MNGFGRKSAVKLMVLAVVLLASSVAFVASGVASSDNGATGQTAQEPLGSLSASPPSGNVQPQQNQDQSGVAGKSGDDDGGSSPGASAGTTASGGGGSSRLPFTGFVAIPLLVAGAGLLIVGVGLRRRTPRTAAS